MKTTTKTKEFLKKKGENNKKKNNKTKGIDYNRK